MDIDEGQESQEKALLPLGLSWVVSWLISPGYQDPWIVWRPSSSLLFLGSLWIVEERVTAGEVRCPLGMQACQAAVGPRSELLELQLFLDAATRACEPGEAQGHQSSGGPW